MIRSARYVYLALIWTFLAAVVFQTFLAGVGLFGVSSMQLHREVGWYVHGGPILLLIAAAVARPGARTIWLNVGLFAIVFVQPLLPGLRGELPFVAALHPVNALLIFWLAAVLARKALALVRATPTEQQLTEPATPHA